MATKEHNHETCRKGNCIECLRETRKPIIDACEKVQFSTKEKDEYKTEIIDKPCDRIHNGTCQSCYNPDAKWHLGKCNLATHLYHEYRRGEKLSFITPITMTVEEHIEVEQKLNPIKASKRGF